MSLSDAFHHRLKAAQRDLIARAGGIERTAAKVDFSKSQVGRWNSPTDPEIMPIIAAVTLEADCGVALVTAVMAEAGGRRLTDPDADKAAAVSLMQAFAENQRQGAELFNAFAVAISDGDFTPTEATTVDRLAAQQEVSLASVRQACAAVKAHGGEAAGLRVVRKD
ncbi:hypothetical protein [Martelella mangrovi]|uniref:Uncharacterized protein n=1 Tax=Martelella mangrovi TaxID=1397477 RepID=A0ABV2IGU3_9HYPH